MWQQRWHWQNNWGQVIVTILCDSGTRYQSQLFNQEWLAAKGLLPD